MSTIKVNSVQPYTGTNVGVTGSLSVSGVISGDGSGLTNVPGGGGVDLIPLNNTWTGINTFENSVNTNLGLNSNDNVSINYPGSQKNLNISVSGSVGYGLGGFESGGKSFGQIYSTATGGFFIRDASTTVGSGLNFNTDSGSVILETKAANIVRMRQKNKTLTLFNTGLSITNTFGGAGVDFNAGVESNYGLNMYNSTKDVGWTLDLNATTGTGNTNSGLYANYGAFYADLMSFQDSSNYTDGAITVHQILNTEDINVTGSLATTVGVSVGTQLVLTDYANLDFADDAAAATGGVPLGGIYRTAGDIKIRIT